MKKTFLFLFLTLSLTVAAVDFRGGTIISAKLLNQCPAGLAKIDPLLYPDLPEDKLYAELTICCTSGRMLSVFDYSIDVFSKDYPCVAIKEKNKKYSTDVNVDYSSDSKKQYTLLFILNRKFVGGAEKLYLKANFPPEWKQEISFTAPGK